MALVSWGSVKVVLPKRRVFGDHNWCTDWWAPEQPCFIALSIVHKVIKPQACLLAGSIIDIESCEYSLAVLYQIGVIYRLYAVWLG